MKRTIKIGGLYHQVRLTIVGKIKMDQKEVQKKRFYLVSQEVVDQIESTMIHGEDFLPMENSSYWRVTTIKGSALDMEIQYLQECELGLHRRRLNVIKRAYNKAHEKAINWINGKVRVVRRMAHKVLTSFERLFAFDVRTGRMINLQEI